MSAMNAPVVPNGFELRFVDPTTVHDNPDNVRGPKRDRTGLAASIKALGILNPPLARQDDDGELWLIAGERRKHSAIAAGIAQIPVYVRTDLSAAQQMAGVLVENRSRTDLSPIEQAVAIQHLAGMEGMTQKAVTELTGVPAKQVRAAVKVGRSEAAVAIAQRHDLTLDQAAVLAGFDDDPSALKELAVAAVRSPWQFEHLASRLQHERDAARQREALTQELTEAGVAIIELEDGWTAPEGAAWLSDLPAPKGRKTLTPAAHKRCPGHAAAIRTRSWGGGAEAAYLCTDPVGHGHVDKLAIRTGTTAPKGGAMTEEQKAERRAVIANNKAWPAASDVRRTFVRQLVGRRTAPKDVLRYVAETLAHFPGIAKVGDDDVAKLIGVEHTGTPWERSTCSKVAADATDARLPLVLFAFVAAGHEAMSSANDTWRRADESLVAYLRFLASMGYGLSELEQEVMDKWDTGAEERAARRAEYEAEDAEDADPEYEDDDPEGE